MRGMKTQLRSSKSAGAGFGAEAGGGKWLGGLADGSGIFLDGSLRCLRLLGGEFIVRFQSAFRAEKFPKFDVSVPFSGVENLAFSVEAGFPGVGNVAESLSMGFSGAEIPAFSVETGFSGAGNVGSRLSVSFSGVENVASSFGRVFREPKILLLHFQRVFRESEKSLKHFGRDFREAEKALSHVQCVYLQHFPPAALCVASLRKRASGLGESGGEIHQ